MDVAGEVGIAAVNKLPGLVLSPIPAGLHLRLFGRAIFRRCWKGAACGHVLGACSGLGSEADVRLLVPEAHKCWLAVPGIWASAMFIRYGQI
jgi:hypothetical protein